ncbi:hypothetical protein JEZ13_08845 [bacterium]|nr:hypothetical protein [bacterium]
MTKEKFFSLVIFWFFVLVYLPLIGNNLPRPFNSVQLATYVWYLSLFLMYESLFRNKFFLQYIILVATFHILTTIFIRHIPPGVIARNTKEFTYMFIGITLLDYFYLNEKSKYYFSKITYWAIVATIITSFVTIALTIYNPTIVRSSYSSGEDLEVFNRYGAGGYGFAALLIMIIPAIFYLIRIEFIHKIKGNIVIGLFLITLLQMQIFANILIGFVVTFFSIIGRKKAKKSYMLMFLIIMIFIFIPQDVYVDSLNSIADNIDPNSLIHRKIVDLAKFISIGEVTEDTATGMKSSRYIMLWDVFSDNPILGGFSVKQRHTWSAGYHLQWMYKLASFGILGLLIHIIIHTSYLKNSLRQFDENYRYYFLLSWLALIGLGFMKNLAGREMWVGYFVLLHGVYYLPLYKRKGRINV